MCGPRSSVRFPPVPPWYENLGKWLVKSPKIYFADTGLLCHLLGIESRAELERSPLGGGVFEAAVASELVKSGVHSGRGRSLHHFRDQQGLEVDFVLPRAGGKAFLVEAKSARTATPADARSIKALLERFERGADGVVVHRSARDASAAASVLAPGVRAVTLQRLLDDLAGRKR
ncbi:MAG: DUF4143 domain-containing protein [Polyangiaceae bacterium]|nr:DUF4143 domain-containing protein [Polyangiaceae bacterium]